MAWRLALALWARPVLAAATQAALALVLFLAHLEGAWRTAGRWWTVYGTVIDLACLVLVAHLLRGERRSVVSLLGLEPRLLGRDLLFGVGIGLLVMITATLGGVGTAAIVGQKASPIGPLPIFGRVYSVLVWPAVWGLAEEITYQGYALPRCVKLVKHPWLAILMVGVPWALQHALLPLVFDAPFVVSRVVSAFPVGLVLMPLYLKTKRLLPFVVGHWLANAVGALMSFSQGTS